MDRVLRVSGRSLAEFMVAFRGSRDKGSVNRYNVSVSTMEESVRRNFDLLRQHPEGIPIIMPNINGRLADGWAKEMAKEDNAFIRDEWRPHLRLSGYTNESDRFLFAVPPTEITFEKHGFPSKEELGESIKSFGRRQIERCRINSLDRPKEAIIGQISFTDRAGDMRILTEVQGSLSGPIEEIYKTYDHMVRFLALIEDPRLSSSDPQVLRLLSAFGNTGIFNTIIIAAGLRVDARARYRAFVVDRSGWLGTKDPFSSALSFNRRVFPEQVSEFLLALDKSAESTGAFNFELQLNSKTLAELKTGRPPTTFKMPIYFHNSASCDWQVYLWI